MKPIVTDVREHVDIAALKQQTYDPHKKILDVEQNSLERKRDAGKLLKKEVMQILFTQNKS